MQIQTKFSISSQLQDLLMLQTTQSEWVLSLKHWHTEPVYLQIIYNQIYIVPYGRNFTD